MKKIVISMAGDWPVFMGNPRVEGLPEGTEIEWVFDHTPPNETFGNLPIGRKFRLRNSPHLWTKDGPIHATCFREKIGVCLEAEQPVIVNK